jgi:hypothetical protein
MWNAARSGLTWHPRDIAHQVLGGDGLGLSGSQVRRCLVGNVGLIEGHIEQQPRRREMDVCPGR